MNDENIIEKITIAIGGVKVDLTPTEVERLYDALSGLLCAADRRPQAVEKHIYHDWYWRYYQPTWVGGTTGTQLPYTVTYLTGTNTAAIAIS